MSDETNVRPDVGDDGVPRCSDELPDPEALPEGVRWSNDVPRATVGLVAAATYPDETDDFDVWVYADADGLHIQATVEGGSEVVYDPPGARLDVVRAVLSRTHPPAP